MLLLTDTNDQTNHQFLATSIDLLNGQNVFKLTCATYADLDISFTLDPPAQIVPPGYTVSVYLFKNPFHVQSHVVDLRTTDRPNDAGRIGYMFNLDALFTPGALQLDQHRYCYAFFGVEYLFQNVQTLQTKDAIIKSDSYRISDFFDEDTIILVLCNEFCHQINNFQFSAYLPNLFLNGYKIFNKQNPVEIENNHIYLRQKYDAFTAVIVNGVYPLRIGKANISMGSEAYTIHLFSNLVQKKFDQVTRFLMLYQVVEIFMPKMIHLEASSRICNVLNTLTSDKVKELVIGLTKQSELITALFTRHAIPENSLSILVRQEILNFFIHVNHPEFADPLKHPDLTLTDLFYAFRNKIVHEYRILHQGGIDNTITETKIATINQLTEILIANTITAFVG